MYNSVNIRLICTGLAALLTWWSCVRALPQDIYVVHCWLINPNKLNLLSWSLAYLSNNKVHSTNILTSLLQVMNGLLQS